MQGEDWCVNTDTGTVHTTMDHNSRSMQSAAVERRAGVAWISGPYKTG